MRVGTKLLKNRLSHYLRLVRAGEQITVTDRGIPVAELRAIRKGVPLEVDALRRLADEGVVTLGTGGVKGFTALKLRRGARLSTAVLDDRR